MNKMINNAVNAFFSCENNFQPHDFIFTEITEKMSMQKREMERKKNSKWSHSLWCVFQGSERRCCLFCLFLSYLISSNIHIILNAVRHYMLNVEWNIFHIWQWAGKHEHTFVDGLFISVWFALHPFRTQFGTLWMKITLLIAIGSEAALSFDTFLLLPSFFRFLPSFVIIIFGCNRVSLCVL